MKILPQLTESALEEFAQFNGDTSAYEDAGREPRQFDWARIDELLMDMFFVSGGFASAIFRDQVEHDVAAISSNDAVRKRLWELAAERVITARNRKDL